MPLDVSSNSTAGLSLSWGLYAQLDELRRWRGRMLDGFGVRPVQTPSRTVAALPGVTLIAYQEPDHSSLPILLVPAPIKRPYIWDLLPRVSVVQRCLQQRLQVYLLQWTRPGVLEAGFGLSEYGDDLILAAVNEIRRETGHDRVFVAGHSLGGTLAAIFAARHPARTRALVLLAAPMHFGADVGTFGTMMGTLMRAHLTDALPGNVPGTVLDVVSVLADPQAYGWHPWMDWLRSQADIEALQVHALVERWTLDEVPLARRLVEEVVQWLYREDRYMRGGLYLHGHRTSPDQISSPVLTVAETESPVAPPASILPFHEALSNSEKRMLWYRGEIGVFLQHVGMLVGRNAHRTLWPAIIEWLHEHRDDGATASRSRSREPTHTGGSFG